MSDFDSNPFADPDFSNPFQVANSAIVLRFESQWGQAYFSFVLSVTASYVASLVYD